MKSISKVLAERNQRITKGVQASKAAKGKDKVPAGRQPVITKGLGIDIATTMLEGESSLRKKMVHLIDCNKGTVMQAILEVEEVKERELKGISDTSDIGKKKRRSISASFSRLLRVMKAIRDRYNIDKMKTTTSFLVMAAYATKTSHKSKGNAPKTQLQASGFVTWDRKLDRVCVKADDPDALARLERHFNHCLQVLAKYDQVTTIPVRDILALTAKGRKATSKLRLAA